MIHLRLSNDREYREEELHKKAAEKLPVHWLSQQPHFHMLTI